MEEMTKEKDITRALYKKVQDKANVVGCSTELMLRVKKGEQILGSSVFRIYVTKKAPFALLAKRDIIPKKLKKIETDIVEVGTVRAYATDRTAKLRPVPLAASVGHEDITAGSLGVLYTKEGHTYAGSNAHVLTPNASLHPGEITNKDICQPGPAHDSAKHVVGLYEWHDRVKPVTEPDCKIANSVVRILNAISKLCGRSTRLFATSPLVTNHQDFGVYKPTLQHVLEVPDASLANKQFIGHLFAGSDVVGVICKAKYAIEKGYTPMIEHAEVTVNDTVWGASFWGDYETSVEDTSAMIQVSYGDFVAMLEDVIIVKNESIVKGGWSGSGWYK